MTSTLSIFFPFFCYSDQTIESYVNTYIPFKVWLLLQCPFFSISFPTSANAKLATFALVVVDILGSLYERDWHWYLRGAYSYFDSNPKTTRLQKPSFHGRSDDSSQISSVRPECPSSASALRSLWKSLQVSVPHVCAIFSSRSFDRNKWGETPCGVW